MKLNELQTKLVNEYAAVVRTEFHTQVKTKGGFHDIWRTGKGALKWRLYGDNKTVAGSPEKLLADIAKHDAGVADPVVNGQPKQEPRSTLLTVRLEPTIWQLLKLLASGDAVYVRARVVGTIEDVSISPELRHEVLK